MSTIARDPRKSSSSENDDPDFVASGVYKKKKKRKNSGKKGKFSLTKLRKKFIAKGFGNHFDRNTEGGASSYRGYDPAMTTTQPAFGGGGGGEGAATHQGQQQQQQVSSSSHGQQNGGGVIQVSLDSPPADGSTATARVVAQVVVASADRASQQTNEQPHFIAVSGPGGRSYTSLTPVNPAGVSDGGGGGVAVAQQGVQFVHYVEGAAEHPLYQSANGQMAYPVYSVGEAGGVSGGGAMYSAAPTYYAAGGGGGVAAVTYASTTTSTSTYLLHHEADVNARDSPVAAGLAETGGGGGGFLEAGSAAGETDAHGNLTHPNRVSPATMELAEAGLATFECEAKAGLHGGGPSPAGRSPLKREMANLNGIYRNPAYLGMVQWLLENYETAEGVSLPRSTLYNHYLRHCGLHKLEPVNAASFGKLIRSVFLGLRTRRLGTRGNSKYHYYGIRIKPGSALNVSLSDEECSNGGGGGCGTGRGNRRYKQPAGHKEEPFDGGSGSNHSGSQSPAGHEYDDSVQVMSSGFAQRQGQTNSHLQYLGDSSCAVPDFPALSLPPGSALPADCTLDDVDTLRSMYREHCEAFLDAVVNMEFATVDSLWREFWRAQDNNNGDECEEEKYLSKTKLYELCKCTAVQEFVRRVDFLFYQNLVQVLIPDVLRPIPSTLTQSIRNFAKGLECWLTAAMTGCPPEMTRLKVSAVGALAQTLRRYTSLNHLAQAARAVLQNAGQIGQMLLDLNRVDFHNVQEQASWVCECEGEVVQRLELDFKSTLQRQNSLEQWAAWLKGVVQQVLKPYEGKASYAKAARQFLLKWSFYSSMVIRDLTLRSAASFGSFHLIRLLYDEYMFYLVEHQVARETGETPIAVMGEKPGADSLEALYGGACNGGAVIKLAPSSDMHSNKRQKIS